MSLTDWTGCLGVSLLLAGFLLNLFKRISADSVVYSSLNFVGAGLACLASVLLRYWPFIILEAAWTIVSAVAVLNSLRRE